MDKERIISNLRRRLDKAEDDIEYHISRKNELKSEIKNLEEKIEDLKENIRNLESRNSDMEKEMFTLRYDLKETEEGNLSIKDFNQQLMRDKNLVNAALENVRKEKLKVEENVLFVSSENRNLRENLNEVKKSNLSKVKCLNEKISMLEATVSDILTCDICEETLESSVELQRHIKAYHKQNVRESKTIKCKVCGKPFRTKGDLERHTIQKHPSIKIKEDLLMKEIKLATDIFQQKERIHKDIFKLRQKYLLSRGQCF